MPILALALASVITFNLTDLSRHFGWMASTRPIAVEVDGDPESEWIVGPIFGTEKRIISVGVNGQICASAPFHADTSWTLDVVNGRSKLTRMIWPHFEIMDLPVPAC